MLVGLLNPYYVTVLSSSEKLCRNLRRLRARHNITQEQLAAAVGMEYKYYQAVEAGRRSRVRLDTLDKLAHPFGLTGAGLIAVRLPASELQMLASSIGQRRRKPKKPVKRSVATQSED